MKSFSQANKKMTSRSYLLNFILKQYFLQLTVFYFSLNTRRKIAYFWHYFVIPSVQCISWLYRKAMGCRTRETNS